ncbi:MAG: secondary thiamine-phosphate synthase enzyme YjbQ [Candidatus Woesearchaeota archaeon]
MKTYRKELSFNTSKRIEFIRITDLIEEIVHESGIKEGICLINSMHITSSVFINDAESGLHKDFLNFLEKLSPKDGHYFHNLTGEDNGYAHIWRTVFGREVVVAITNGNLDLGPWEEIFYGEFDGQRKKRVLVKIIGE